MLADLGELTRRNRSPADSGEYPPVPGRNLRIPPRAMPTLWVAPRLPVRLVPYGCRLPRESALPLSSRARLIAVAGLFAALSWAFMAGAAMLWALVLAPMLSYGALFALLLMPSLALVVPGMVSGLLVDWRMQRCTMRSIQALLLGSLIAIVVAAAVAVYLNARPTWDLGDYIGMIVLSWLGSAMAMAMGSLGALIGLKLADGILMRTRRFRLAGTRAARWPACPGGSPWKN